jgi:hypothetical protein
MAKGSGNYNCIDDVLNNLMLATNQLYYRLEIVDNNGSKTYSTIQQITIKSQTPNIVISPNPTKESVTIECLNGSQLIISDITGRVYITKQMLDNQPIKLACNNLNKGLYLVSIILKNGTTATEKLIVE